MAESITNIRDTDTRVTILETRVSGLSNNLEKIETKIETNYNTLHHRISELRDDLREDIEAKHEKVIEKLDDHVKNSDAQNDELKRMIAHIEKWRWMIMGGALVVGYVLAHIKIENLF